MRFHADKFNSFGILTPMLILPHDALENCWLYRIIILGDLLMRA